MGSLRRALRMATRYRAMLVSVLLSSMAVAVFWGANLGTVYPIVDVVLKGRSLKVWVADNVEEASNSCDQWERRVASLESQIGAATPSQTTELQRDLRVARNRWAADRKALDRAQTMQPWIQRFTPDQPFATLLLVVTALLIGTALKSLFIIINVVLVEKLSLLVAFQHRQLLFRRTMKMDLASMSTEHTSQLISNFTHDVECLASGVKTVFGRAIREPLKVIACLTGAAFICWRLLLLSMIVTPLAVYLINRLAKSVKRASHRALSEMSNLYQRLSESLAGIELVKAYTMERHERRQFHQISKDYLFKSIRIAFYRALSKPINEFVSISVVASAILVGGYLVLNEATHLFGVLKMCDRPLNFGSLMTFFALMAGVSDPFRKLADVYTEIQRAAAAADRIYQVVDRVPQVSDPEHPVALSTLQTLEFDGIGFGYTPNQQVLQDVQLTIKAGETIAIVGPNGCGKSTFVKMIPRFYDPTSGEIRWNGKDLRQLRRKDLRRRIGFVTQRTLLFNDTVFNNIRYGSLDATREDVMEAARRAHAHEFITTELEGQYDAIVGEGGNSLSGGQRQRIAMARALLCDPELLILDEATSQVDLESERLIRDSLQQFTKDRTAVVITHRLETLSICDRIVVMDDGQIIAVGSHEQLLGTCAVYRRLHQLQFKVPA